MAKYAFDGMQPLEFEALVKALIHASLGLSAETIIFGAGRDGGREATWSQPSGHPAYIKPQRTKQRRNREWVFQVKHHDPNMLGRTPVGLVADDLDSELTKLVKKHHVPCDTYVLVTNHRLSGVRHSGARDRVAKAVKKWKRSVSDIRVWDSATLSAMLDSFPGIRQTYLDHIVTGDLLKALLESTERPRRREQAVVKAYLEKFIKSVGVARSDEAGDESEGTLKLEDVFVDLDVSLSIPDADSPVYEAAQCWADKNLSSREPDAATRRSGAERVTVAASTALLLSDAPAALLEAGPGFGKSTLCQYIAVYHATRLVHPDAVSKLVSRMALPGSITPADLESFCQPRLPFRVELRRFANWRNDSGHTSIAQYVAEELINTSADAALNKEDVFGLIAGNPVLLILDGLDEVPNRDKRVIILEDTATFLDRARAENADVVLLLSTRPQGYNKEFDRFSPITWQIDELTRSQFDEYSAAWLRQRVQDEQERKDALARVVRGLESPEVRRLAVTLLQATVILTIAKNKHDIPHERSTLFKRYVDTIFEREKQKSPLVKLYERELHRLHELAAYEIHKAMEGGKGGTVTDVRFRELVRTVWDTYRGAEPLPGGLSSVVDAIRDAARDRLVFLAGQGEKQSEIGFVISSFREYFAAQYLKSHEEADRDRVFAALLKREAHWENVLIFYAGSQDAADQRRWVLAPPIDLTRSDASLVTRARFRRMLLKLMPEFRALRRDTFERALQEVFASDTLWTWRRLDWPTPLLRNLRSGQAAEILLPILYAAAARDGIGRQAALSLAGEVSEGHETLWAQFAGVINAMTREPSQSALAAYFALQFDVPLREKPPDEVWEEAIYELDRITDPVAERIGANIPAAFAIRRWVVHREYAVFSLRAHPLIRALGQHDRELRFGKPTGFMRPFALGAEFPTARAVEALQTKYGLGDDLYMSLVLAVAAAIQAPTDTVIEERARQLAVTLDASRFVNDYLGPPSSWFRDAEQMAEYRKRLHSSGQSGELAAFLLELLAESGPVGSAIVSTHPDIWGEFGADGWRALKRINEIRRKVPAEIMSIPRRAVSYLEENPYEWSRRNETIDVVSLMRFATIIAKVTSEGGAGLFADGRLPSLRSVAPSINASLATQFRQLVSHVNGWRELPNAWRAAVLFAGLANRAVGIDDLVTAWEQLEKPTFFLHIDDKMASRVDELVGSVREDSLTRSLGLLSHILGSVHSSVLSAGRSLSVIIIRSLRADALADREVEFALRVLASLPVLDDEAALWQEARFVERVRESAYLTSLFRTRVDPNIRPIFAGKTSRIALEAIVGQRNAVPEVSQAALERLASEDIAEAGPMRDSEWHLEE